MPWYIWLVIWFVGIALFCILWYFYFRRRFPNTNVATAGAGLVGGGRADTHRPSALLQQNGSVQEQPTNGIDAATAAVALLPAKVTYELPQGFDIPIASDGREWHSLRIAPDECTLIAGARRRGKGNLLQVIGLSSLMLGPEVLHLWVIDLKTGLDYLWARKVAHARLYANGPDVDGTLAEGYFAVLVEMKRREYLLAKAGKRNIGEYNASGVNKLPYLLLICDEIADLPARWPEDLKQKPEIAVARLVGTGDPAMLASITRSIQEEGLLNGGLIGAVESVARLSGASGIMLDAATQRPDRSTVDGQIQANTPNRVVLGLASSKDTEVALSLGKGEKPRYDPAGISEPGVAVIRRPGRPDVIGRVPEMTERVRDGLVAFLVKKFPRPQASEIAVIDPLYAELMRRFESHEALLEPETNDVSGETISAPFQIVKEPFQGITKGNSSAVSAFTVEQFLPIARLVRAKLVRETDALKTAFSVSPGGTQRYKDARAMMDKALEIIDNERSEVAA